MMRKWHSVRRSSIDENNDSVSKSWFVFQHGIVVKLTSAAEFSDAEDLTLKITLNGLSLFKFWKKFVNFMLISKLVQICKK